MAIAGGTRRRNTVGFSRRSLWTSTSTYKSDLVASLPDRPSNAGAYLCIFLGVCGLLFALFVATNANDASWFALLVGIVSLLFLVGGIKARKTPEQLNAAQSSWDSRWLCARCGYQWQQ